MAEKKFHQKRSFFLRFNVKKPLKMLNISIKRQNCSVKNVVFKLINNFDVTLKYVCFRVIAKLKELNISSIFKIKITPYKT